MKGFTIFRPVILPYVRRGTHLRWLSTSFRDGQIIRHLFIFFLIWDCHETIITIFILSFYYHILVKDSERVWVISSNCQDKCWIEVSFDICIVNQPRCVFFPMFYTSKRWRFLNFLNQNWTQDQLSIEIFRLEKKK